jgi:hypothetical protein
MLENIKLFFIFFFGIEPKYKPITREDLESGGDELTLEPSEPKTSKPTRIARKKRDTNPLTEYQINTIKDMYTKVEIHKCRTRQEYAKFINSFLGVDKSYTVICKVLRGGYDDQLTDPTIETNNEEVPVNHFTQSLYSKSA